MAESMRDLFHAVDNGVEVDPDTFADAYAFNIEAACIDLATYTLDLMEAREVEESQNWDPDTIDPASVVY